MRKHIALALALCLVLTLALTACGPEAVSEIPSPAPAQTVSPEPVSSAPPAPSETPAAQREEVHVAVLAGPTGVGAAKLMADSEAGTTAHDYRITVEADNSAVTTKLANKEYDIAAIATNVAANLYNKTNGQVQLCAINTLGVLYILGKGTDALDAGTLASLKGRSLYAFGQGANPEYVLNYLLRENGVEPQEVDIHWMAADEVTATMLQAEGEALCMLPVPAATALTAKSGGEVQPVYSLSEEWDALDNGSQLTMGCVVVRTQFAQEHPQAVKDFLAEYAASVAYMAANEGEEPAQLVEQYGLAPSAAIAKRAIPQCNLVCITGEAMEDAIKGYYDVLWSQDPAAVGGKVPGEDFYFLGD